MHPSLLVLLVLLSLSEADLSVTRLDSPTSERSYECSGNSISNNVQNVIWKRNMVEVAPDSRISIMNHLTLVIGEITPADESKIQCCIRSGICSAAEQLIVSPQVDPLLPTSHQVYVQSGIILPCGILVGPITSASRPFTVTWQVVNSTGRFTLFTASYNLPGEEPINMTTGIYEYNAEDYSLGVSNFIGITENLTFQCKISPSTNPVSRTINVTLLYVKFKQPLPSLKVSNGVATVFLAIAEGSGGLPELGWRIGDMLITESTGRYGVSSTPSANRLTSVLQIMDITDEDSSTLVTAVASWNGTSANSTSMVIVTPVPERLEVTCGSESNEVLITFAVPPSFPLFRVIDGLGATSILNLTLTDVAEPFAGSRNVTVHIDSGHFRDLTAHGVYMRGQELRLEEGKRYRLQGSLEIDGKKRRNDFMSKKCNREENVFPPRSDLCTSTVTTDPTKRRLAFLLSFPATISCHDSEQSPGNLTEAVLSSFEKNQTYECFDLTKPQLTCHNASLGNLSVTVFSFSLLLLERQLLATQNLPMSSFSVVSIGPPPATVSTSTTATATTPEAEGQEQGKYNYIIAAVSALAVVSVLGIFIVCVVLFNKTRKKRPDQRGLMQRNSPPPPPSL